jgi:hypothetical protein
VCQLTRDGDHNGDHDHDHDDDNYHRRIDRRDDPPNLDNIPTATSPQHHKMFSFLRGLFGAVFLLTIILSIPIAFDVGGRDSGLAYSLALFAYYFVDSAVKIASEASAGTRRRFGIRWALSTTLRLSQWIVIPSLLIWALGQFAVDAGPGGGATGWVERTVAGVMSSVRSGDAQTWREWALGKGGVIETLTLGGWDALLMYSSPVFQLLEGFCALLVIQAAGQITRWLVNRGRSDTWVVSMPYLEPPVFFFS